MHSLVEPPKDEDWIGLEDELAPTEIRRRIRGKVSLSHLALSLSDPSQDGGVKEDGEELEPQGRSCFGVFGAASSVAIR